MSGGSTGWAAVVTQLDEVLYRLRSRVAGGDATVDKFDEILKATCIDTFDKLRAYKSGSRGFEKMERLGGLLYPGKDDMALMQADGFLITLALEMAAIVARDFPQLGPTIEMPSPGMSTTAEAQGAPPKNHARSENHAAA